MSKKHSEVVNDRIYTVWIEGWCAGHVNELEDYRGLAIAVHRDEGIVASAPTLAILWDHVSFLRKKVRRVVAVTHANNYLPALDDGSFGPAQPPTVKTDPLDIEDEGPAEELTNLPPPLDDPSDNSDQVIDGSREPDPSDVSDFNAPEEPMTIRRFSKMHGLNQVAVLIKVLSWGNAGFTVSNALDNDTLLKLEKEFSKAPPPFPSPDKQPPFTPHRPPGGLGRGVVLDGAGSAGYHHSKLAFD
jgi:hypothetical protein